MNTTFYYTNANTLGHCHFERSRKAWNLAASKVGLDFASQGAFDKIYFISTNARPDIGFQLTENQLVTLKDISNSH